MAHVVGQIGAGIAAPTGPTQANGILVAIPAGIEASILLPFVGTPAERFARVGPRCCPGSFQADRTKESACDDGPKSPKRFPSGNRFFRQ